MPEAAWRHARDEETIMSYWCDNELTITGPDRQAVLDVLTKTATDKFGDFTIYFGLEALTKRVKELGIPIPNLAERSLECPMGSVYIFNQRHEATGDSDILYFQSQWVEPVEAVTVLSQMFPQNTFLLDAWCDDLGQWSGEGYTGVYNARVCRSSFQNGVETKFPLGEDGRSISTPVTTENGITSFFLGR
jgi:hypothetical protein